MLCCSSGPFTCSLTISRSRTKSSSVLISSLITHSRYRADFFILASSFLAYRFLYHDWIKYTTLASIKYNKK